MMDELLKDEEKMTPEKVRVLVDNLRRYKRDPETFHSMEDDVLIDVLKAIADNNCEKPQECAKIALEPGDWDVERWYA